MADSPKVILSGFADEVAENKTLDQPFSTFAALGLSHFSIRFLDAGCGIKNVLQLTDAEVVTVRNRMAEFGLRVSSIGSPIGKVKLLDVDDGTSNRYIEPISYLSQDVRRACELAQAFETRLIRGFSFYHPRDSKAETYVDQVVDRLGPIVEECDQRGLTFGLEVEANLVGHTGWLLAEIHRRVNHPALVLVFDGANLRIQGFSPEQIFEQYMAMKPALGWLHVKDYRGPDVTAKSAFIDEEALNQFVPVGLGESAYDRIFADLRDFLPQMGARLAQRNIDGVCLELEPHLKKGGQFGGYSGADGFCVAMRHLCVLLDASGIEYDLRESPGRTPAL